MRSLVLLVCLAACGGAQASPSASGDPNRQVALGEWCKTLTQTMCQRAGACIGSPEFASSCTDRVMTSCLASRAERTPAGHTGADLASCNATFQNAPCDGYMGVVASHVECQARAAQP